MQAATSPASDIPQRARALYLLNRVRMLVDVDAPQAPLMPALLPGTEAPLDMSMCQLRSMSPIHLQYLRNMGVTATLTASLVREGQLFTPSERYVLPGVSRQMTIDCARKLGIPCTPGDIDLFDAANAEEMFLTSTSLCILPVKSFNGSAVGDGKHPGPITKKLIDAYSKDVGCDFIAQYLKFLN